MNILLADSRPQVRSALRLLLEQTIGAHIVGEASYAQAMLACAEIVHPDAILVDWDLPGLRAVGSISSVRQAYPSVRIIVLSSQPHVREMALRAGADAFVSKGDPPEQLLAALNDCCCR